MKKFILITSFLFNGLFISAQSNNADSLKKLLLRPGEDSSRVMLLAWLSIELQRSNPDSAFLLSRQGFKLAKQINFPNGELYCKIATAGCFWSIGDYSSAIRLLLPDIKRIERTNDMLLRSYMYSVLQDSHRDQGDYTEALKYASKTSSIIETIEHGRFCKIHTAAIASIYLGKGELDSAEFYLQKALLYQPSFGFDGWIYSVAGRTYVELKKYDSAFNFFHLSIQSLMEVNNLKDLAGAYNNITSLFITIGQKDSALFYARQSLAISQPKNFAREILESSMLMSTVFERVEPDSSLFYYKQAMSARDSVFNQEKQRQVLSYKFTEELKQQEIESDSKEYKNQVKIYSLAGLVVIFLIIAFLLFRNNANKQKAYSLLQIQKEETDKQKIKAEQALEELKTTQTQLIQSEKMASLGELTAGIAHEIQNPLNFINNFSEVNTELIEEMNKEIDKGNIQEVRSVAIDLKENEQKINHHGKRAAAIVKGMLQHSRTSSGHTELTDINVLADEYLRLSYHGLRAKDKSFNATISIDFDKTMQLILVEPQDIGRALLNLFNNAFYSVTEKKKKLGTDLQGFDPTVSVSTKKLIDKIEIKVKDNGVGISQSVVDRIFQPFFTTKPTGYGTGLGLSIGYDIIKVHGGELKVNTKEGEFAEFIITLPLNQ